MLIIRRYSNTISGSKSDKNRKAIPKYKNSEFKYILKLLYNSQYFINKRKIQIF